MKFELYFSTSPPPKNLAREQLERMMPARFSSEDDAVYGAALVIRGGQYPWLIEGPGLRPCRSCGASSPPRSAAA